MKNHSKVLKASVVSVACALLLWSCTREPIHRPLPNVRISFRVDLSLKDSTQWVKPDTLGPSLLKTNFYNHQTHKLEGYMYSTKEGGVVSGVGAGTYDVIVFNDDAQFTRISGEDDFNTIMARTDKVATKIRSRSKTADQSKADDGGNVDESVAIAMPDHLFVGRAISVTIPEFLQDKDTLMTINAELKTIIQSYKIEIDGIKGLENVNGADLYLCGHSAGYFLGQAKVSDEEAILHVPCQVDLLRNCIKASCTTFGKLAEAGGLARVHLVVDGADGTVYDFETDISEQYLRPDHILKFHLDAEITSRDASTFRPEVEEWDRDITNISIY